MLLYWVEPVDCQNLCTLSTVGGELPKDIGSWVGAEQGGRVGGGSGGGEGEGQLADQVK